VLLINFILHTHENTFQVAQVCAYEFGIEVGQVKVKATNTLTDAGGSFTGSSVTSELVCQVSRITCKYRVKSEKVEV